MLQKKFRFHSRGGVKFVYRTGKTLRRPELSLIFCENSRHYTRFAVVVSKKVLKSAVARNRVRRRLYEAIRLNLEKIPKDRDYIFVVYSPSLQTLPFDKLSSLVRSLIEESMIQ